MPYMTTFLKKWTILINETLCPYHEALGRLSEQEIAELLKRSERSIRRDWQKARLFLLSAMQED